MGVQAALPQLEVLQGGARERGIEKLLGDKPCSAGGVLTIWQACSSPYAAASGSSPIPTLSRTMRMTRADRRPPDAPDEAAIV